MGEAVLTGPAALRRSPLADLAGVMAAGSGPAVTLTEEPYAPMVALRCEPGSAAATRVGDVLGSPLPGRVGDTADCVDGTVLWLGPDEWLVVGRIGGSPAPALVTDLRTAIGADRGDAVDVSSNRTTLRLDGPSARAVLEKGCPVDLHPRAFGPGRAVTTTLARVPLLLWQVGPEAYRLLPRSSFADYVARWLLDAMVEHTAGDPR